MYNLYILKYVKNLISVNCLNSSSSQMIQFILFQTLKSWYNNFYAFVSVEITILE